MLFVSMRNMFLCFLKKKQRNQAFITFKGETTTPQNQPTQILQDVHTFFTTFVVGKEEDMKKIHSTKESYAAFVYLFAKCIVSSTLFKDMIQSSQGKFDTTFTNCDEALCLLILDNNLQKWVGEAEKKIEMNDGKLPRDLTISLTKKDMKDIPKSKYTMGIDNATNNLRSGWNQDGMKKYKDFQTSVDKFRESNVFNEFKTYALSRIVNKKGGDRSKKQRTSINDDSSSVDNTAEMEKLVHSIHEGGRFAV